MNKQFYIYVARQYGQIKYIGKGQGKRYKHITSGISHCYEANRAHFLEPNTVEVKIEAHFESEEECLEMEELLIQTLEPEWNKEHLTLQRNKTPEAEHIRAIPVGQRLDREFIASTLELYPYLSPTSYLLAAGMNPTKEATDSLRELGFKQWQTTRVVDTRKTEARQNTRLDTVVALLTAKKNKEAKMPVLLERFAISKPTFARYKKEFTVELRELGLVK